jgi:cold shock CspA family protein
LKGSAKHFRPRIVWRPNGSFCSFSLRAAATTVFVHISAVERAGLRSLNEGQAIEFELVSNRGEDISGEFEGSLIGMSGIRFRGRLRPLFIFVAALNSEVFV